MPFNLSITSSTTALIATLAGRVAAAARSGTGETMKAPVVAMRAAKNIERMAGLCEENLPM